MATFRQRDIEMRVVSIVIRRDGEEGKTYVPCAYHTIGGGGARHQLPLDSPTFDDTNELPHLMQQLAPHVVDDCRAVGGRVWITVWGDEPMWRRPRGG